MVSRLTDSATLFLLDSTAMAFANACCRTILLHSLYLFTASWSFGLALREKGERGREGEREGGREGGRERGRGREMIVFSGISEVIELFSLLQSQSVPS